MGKQLRADQRERARRWGSQLAERLAKIVGRGEGVTVEEAQWENIRRLEPWTPPTDAIRKVVEVTAPDGLRLRMVVVAWREPPPSDVPGQ